MKTMRLRHLATVMNSNVDKVIDPAEISVRLCNYVDVYNNDFIDPNLDFSEGSATKKEIDRFGLRVGDVIITKDSEDRLDIGVPAYVRETADDLVCGYHLSLVRAKSEVMHGDFLFWALQSQQARDAFSNVAFGITRYGLTLGGIKDVAVNCPDLETQKSIANFLDRQTRRINQLIEKKQRLIEVLAEARNARIAKTITVGLNDSAQLVATNSKYLPFIPEHWRIWRLKQLARVRGGLTLGRRVPETAKVSTVPYLRVANVQAGWIDLNDVAEISATESEISRFGLKDGDILMNEGGDNDKLGRGAVWRAPFSPCLNQNHVFCVRAYEKRHAEWISMATSARYARDFFYLHSNQSTNLASISKTNLERFPVPMPPESERESILRQLTADLERIQELLNRTAQSVERLHEYSSALITAAVTGQIDVSTWAKRGDADQRLDQIEDEMAAGFVAGEAVEAQA